MVIGLWLWQTEDRGALKNLMRIWNSWDQQYAIFVYHLWKKGQATQEEYRDLVRSCREEIRKAKAQLELNLATIVRYNKKCFYKYVNNKKRAKENIYPLFDTEGNIATRDEEKAEVLNAFFTSVLNSETSYPQGTLPLELEGKDGEQNISTIILEEIVTYYALWTLTSFRD